MDSKKLYIEILKFFSFTPTRGQATALSMICNYLTTTEELNAFILKGYAGTGKTTLISSLIKFLDTYNQSCILLAPTGRAAKILSSYSKHTSTTIHRTIYRLSRTNTEETFTLSYNNHKDTLFIVDEASMISNRSSNDNVFKSNKLLEDLLEYIYTGENCKLILIGDTAQLPPVGTNLSPALDRDELRILGIKASEYELTDVVRQNSDSGILYNATELRNILRFGNTSTIPQILCNKIDVIHLRGEDILEMISSSFDRVGIDQSKVICYSNKRAVLFNKGIRNSILYKEDEISSGDPLMIAKNNYLWSEEYPEIPFIANGDLVRVVRIQKQYELYGFRFADVLIKFQDYDWELEVRILLDSLTEEAPALKAETRQKLFEAIAEDYSDCRSKKELYGKLKKDKWLQSLQVKFGYAFTCHKAQGGQWKEIFIDQGYFFEDQIGPDYFRWLYTAITRGTEKIFLMNFREEFIKQ